MSKSLLVTSLLVTTSLLISDHVGVSRAEPEMGGTSTKSILRARGYQVEEHFFTTRDGYRLRLTRGLNPHFAGAAAAGALPEKLPILFVHGILEAENVFVINSRGARAKNLLVELNVSSTTELTADELKARLAREPSARSLPLLALNCGHEVWLLSRRGFPGSQELVGDPASLPAGEEELVQFQLTSVSSWLSSLAQLFSPREIAFSFDKRFWNFSLDEQADHDFPQAVDYVLAASPAHSQISVVSHSAGGALQLMALSTQPQLASKIASSVLWSPGYSLGHGDMWNALAFLDPLLTRYTGAIPPAFTTFPLQTLAGSICSNPLTQFGLCEFVADFLLGPSGGQEPITADYLDTVLFSSSSHELAQNVQMIARHGRIHRFNWGSPARNQLAYGRDHPPAYNSSLISSTTMSFYAAPTDVIVSAADVQAAVSGLKVPYEYHLISGTFNHQGYFYHKRTAELVIINSMRELELLARRAN